MKYIWAIFMTIIFSEKIFYDFSFFDLNRRIKSEGQGFTLNEFFTKDFINDNWEKLIEGINFRLPPEFRDKKTIFEARACIKNDKRYLVVNIAGEDTEELMKRVENFIEEIKDYPPYDDLKLIIHAKEVDPKEPLRDAFSILNLNNLEFSTVIDDLEFYIKEGDIENELAGDGYTQIDKVSKNVLNNLFNCICNEILYYLSPGQINDLVDSMFEGKNAFVNNLISLSEYYQQLIEGKQDMEIIILINGVSRIVKDIKTTLERLNYGISYFQRMDKGNLFYRIFYRHFIRPHAIIPEGEEKIKLDIFLNNN